MSGVPGTYCIGNSKHDVTGQVVAIDDHESGRVSYVLIDSRTKRMIPLPERDRNNRPARTGDVAVAACTVDPVTNQCSYVASGDVTLLNVPSAPIPKATPSQVKLLVMVADAPVCNSPMEKNLTEIKTAYLGPNFDGQEGTAKMLEDCSYGLTTIVPSAFQAIRVPITSSSQCWNITTCVYNDFWDVLSARARAQVGDATFNSFNYYAMVFKADHCRWAGMATVGGNIVWNKAWILGIGPGMQEILHNFALWHNYNSSGAEYKDSSSYMGSGDSCPGAAEMAWLGWASPAVGAGGLNSAAMPAGRPTATWNLPASYLTGVGNYIRLVPDWVPTYVSNYNLDEGDPGVSRNVYLYVKVPGSYADSWLDPRHHYKLLVHDVVAFLDNNMGAYSAPNRRIAYQMIPCGLTATHASASPLPTATPAPALATATPAPALATATPAPALATATPAPALATATPAPALATATSASAFVTPPVSASPLPSAPPATAPVSPSALTAASSASALAAPPSAPALAAAPVSASARPTAPAAPSFAAALFPAAATLAQVMLQQQEGPLCAEEPTGLLRRQDPWEPGALNGTWLGKKDPCTNRGKEQPRMRGGPSGLALCMGCYNRNYQRQSGRSGNALDPPLTPRGKKRPAGERLDRTAEEDKEEAMEEEDKEVMDLTED
ncbi:hypothetical protein HYH03_007679 [Edaphochlamys debaryana]|uniref:Peptidase M11 gametolysin domain-containing protein n=1 Tax=Edaphochlamys debaryana TaxID=47281 RepID=A0A835Y2K0_9CHLO|nr:hypothetical protein HYH03_007679 [Edaphochlamys debaryana]|eukprot:KAG2494032.1 hypothetical protein HYH03_007679 [Edaphochlamys debaryana]